MTVAIEDSLAGSDGHRLFFRCWRPETAPRAIVAIVPGFNSHSGYYQWAADRLVEAGLAVYAVDLRGRGRSEGERFFVESFSDYVADLAAMIALARQREPGLPLFLMGHSAGGVVAALYALDHQGELGGLICESFAYELPAPNLALAAIKGISHLAPHAHVLHLKNADFSRDPEVVGVMDSDPLIAGETQPAQTLAALVRADETLKKEFGRMVLPLLILHGSDDRAARPSGSRHFFEAAGATDKAIRIFEGSFHDPLSDLDREGVMGEILEWIGRRI